MTKQEIEQAAKEWSGFPEKDTYPYFDAFIAGATMVNERQPYSMEDMAKYVRWFNTRQIWFDNRKMKWVVPSIYMSAEAEYCTDEELIKLWEETRNVI